MKRAIVLSLAFLMVLSALALIGDASVWGSSITIAPVFEARAGPSHLRDVFSLSELDSALLGLDEAVADGFFVDGLTELEAGEYLLLTTDETFAIDTMNILSGSSGWVFLSFHAGNDCMFTDLASAIILVVLEENIDYAHVETAINIFSDYYWLKESAVTDRIENSAELTGYSIVRNWVLIRDGEVHLLIRK